MKSRKALIFWCALLLVIVCLTVFAQFISPYGTNEMNMDRIYEEPGKNHVLGTDHLGRDVMTRLLEGGKATLSIAVVSVLMSLIIGVIYGGISGYIGGFVDVVMMRFLEALIAIPSVIIILAFQAMMQGGVWSMAFIIGITNWLVTARIVRSEFIRLREAEFVQMAKMFGTPTWKIILQHMLRNSIPAVFVVTLFNFAGAVFMEVSLSFLGIGVPPSIPSWGSMLYYAQNDILIGAWWIGVFPGLMIFATILAINFIGEALKNPERRRLNA